MELGALYRVPSLTFLTMCQGICSVSRQGSRAQNRNGCCPEHTAFGGRTESLSMANTQAHPITRRNPTASPAKCSETASDGKTRESFLEEMASKLSLKEAQFFPVCIYSRHPTFSPSQMAWWFKKAFLLFLKHQLETRGGAGWGRCCRIMNQQDRQRSSSSLPALG